ncbi:MAG: DUF3137 domain-containing protein [Fimbriimonadales bacterium]|nr:DUF3137 domain-containing protein [Fimbriimonadales bacterium]
MSVPTGDFDQFYQEQLQPILHSLEAERQQKTQRFGKIALISIVVGGLLTLLLAAVAREFGLLAFLPMGGALLVILIAYGMMTSEWSRLFKWRVLTRLVKFVSPELEYQPERYISEEEFRSSLLFQRDPDRYRGEDLIEGRVGQTALRLSELHAEYKTEHYDSKGNRRTTWHTLFRGLFIVADFNKHFHGITLVLPDVEQNLLGWFGQMLQGLSAKLGMQPGELVKLEDPEFERAFKVYSTDQIEARYILTPSLMERILRFRQLTKSEIRLAFIASRLYVAIPTTHDHFEAPSLFAPVGELLKPETIGKYLHELRFALAVVDELNLNTRIWTKR